VRKIAFAAVVALLTIGASRTVTTQPPPANPADALLAEVRALRNDVNRAAGASIRTQLLVARLQLQEQRINTVSRQLSDVQAQISATCVPMMATRMRQLENMLRNSALPQEERTSAEQEMTELRAPMEDAQRRADALATQEATLTHAFSAEQSRWLELSQRLDQLERDITRR
jgi:predicted  nucleic acid-binding Zn-ribbon protein